MSHPNQIELVRRLAARAPGALPAAEEVGEIPVAHYVSPAHFERERALFRRLPQLVAVSSELAAQGSCIAVDVSGVPLVLTRSDDGALRTFRNVCRHRSTPLLSERGPFRKKALVCPYHGWTYDLAGQLIHVPHREAFAGCERERDALVAASALELHGLVWASLEPTIDAEFLAPIADELRALDAGSWSLHRRSERMVRGNWKLVIDAFLDAYHIRQLHKDTIYRFFVDALAEAEPAGDHIRAVTARRSLREAGAVDGVTDVRQLATPSYLVFPNVILILHPDYLSVLVSEPLAVDRTRFVHWMLVPRPAATQSETAHWEKSFSLIDEGVFEREDLFAVEAMQRGLESGINSSVLFGMHENAALWFHAALARHLA